MKPASRVGVAAVVVQTAVNSAGRSHILFKNEWHRSDRLKLRHPKTASKSSQRRRKKVTNSLSSRQSSAAGANLSPLSSEACDAYVAIRPSQAESKPLWRDGTHQTSCARRGITRCMRCLRPDKQSYGRSHPSQGVVPGMRASQSTSQGFAPGWFPMVKIRLKSG